MAIDKNGKFYLPLDTQKQERYFKFEDVYKEYYDKLYMEMCKAVGEDVWDAEDLTQETFTCLYESYNKVLPDQPHMKYLIQQIGKNIFLMYQREIIKERTSFGEQADTLSMLNNSMSNSNDFRDAYEVLKSSQQITDLLGKVNEFCKIDKDIVHNVFIQGTPPKEAAENMGLSYDNVRKRIQRLRERLYVESE